MTKDGGDTTEARERADAKAMNALIRGRDHPAEGDAEEAGDAGPDDDMNDRIRAAAGRPAEEGE